MKATLFRMNDASHVSFFLLQIKAFTTLNYYITLLILWNTFSSLPETNFSNLWKHNIKKMIKAPRKNLNINS